RDLAAKPRPEQTNAEMIELMQELNALDARGFNETFGPPQLGSPHVGPRFEARDIEHTLCEFDKYERVRLNEGKMRSKYDWRKATTLA
ncbi:nucleotide kinase domain-containing protein, partial [Staphylococcus aureus]